MDDSLQNYFLYVMNIGYDSSVTGEDVVSQFCIRITLVLSIIQNSERMNAC